MFPLQPHAGLFTTLGKEGIGVQVRSTFHPHILLCERLSELSLQVAIRASVRFLVSARQRVVRLTMVTSSLQASVKAHTSRFLCVCPHPSKPPALIFSLIAFTQSPTFTFSVQYPLLGHND